MKQSLQEAINEVFTRYRDGIVQMVVEYPEMSYEAVARHWNVSANYVYRLSRKAGVRREADKATEVSND